MSLRHSGSLVLWSSSDLEVLLELSARGIQPKIRPSIQPQKVSRASEVACRTCHNNFRSSTKHDYTWIGISLMHDNDYFHVSIKVVSFIYPNENGQR